MATRTITALFDSYDRAAEAVRKLEAAGVAHGDISVVSNDASHKRFYEGAGTNDQVGGTGTGTGASLGTLLGGGAGLLAGLGMLAIPGLGPVVAAGWLASTLVGAGVGAAAGGMVGLLTDAGVSHADAHLYAEGVKRGGTLLTVRADDSMAGRVQEILDVDGTVDLNERTGQWRSEGWDGNYAGVDPTGVVPPSAGYPPVATGADMGPAETQAAPAGTIRRPATPDTVYPPVSDYGTTPRPGEPERTPGRDRVRIYPDDPA